jgi:hypothetical protein
MKKSTRSTIIQSLLFIVSLGLIYLIYGQKVFLGYIGIWVGSVFGVIAATLIGMVGYFWIKQFFQTHYPIQEPDPSEAYALEISSYKVYELIFEILITIGLAIGGFLSYKLLVWLSIEWLKLIPGVYVVPIGDGIWLIPSILMGALLGILIAPLGMKIILRNRYKSFIMYLELFNWNMNSKKLLQWIVIGFLIINSILVYCFLASYTRFTEEGIFIHRANPFSEEFHSYTQISKIEDQFRTVNSETTHKYIIQFADGYQWSRSSTISDNNPPDSYLQIIKFVSEKSGKPYNQVEYKKKKGEY